MTAPTTQQATIRTTVTLPSSYCAKCGNETASVLIQRYQQDALFGAHKIHDVESVSVMHAHFCPWCGERMG